MFICTTSSYSVLTYTTFVYPFCVVFNAGPRMEDSTALDLKSSISCAMNKWAIIVCLTYLSTTPLCCTVPCMLCRHVLVVVTTEQSSVLTSMIISPSERTLLGFFMTVSVCINVAMKAWMMKKIHLVGIRENANQNKLVVRPFSGLWHYLLMKADVGCQNV